MENLSDGKQQKIGEVKIEKPIEVVFEGADKTIIKPLNVNEVNKKILKEILADLSNHPELAQGLNEVRLLPDNIETAIENPLFVSANVIAQELCEPRGNVRTR